MIVEHVKQMADIKRRMWTETDKILERRRTVDAEHGLYLVADR